MVTLTSADAQNCFGQLLDTAQREPVAITRHGRPTAFLISPTEMEALLEARRRRSAAVKAFEEWSDRAREHASPEAAELTDEDIVRMVHELR